MSHMCLIPQGLKYLKMSTIHKQGRWMGRRPRAKHGGAKRRSAEWDGVLGGAPQPLPSMGVKILKFNSANLFIFSTISRQRQLFHPLFFIHLLHVSVLIISVRNLHYIFLLHIAHSSKVNYTLDKVNCTLCVRKHAILGSVIPFCGRYPHDDEVPKIQNLGPLESQYLENGKWLHGFFFVGADPILYIIIIIIIIYLLTHIKLQ